MVPEKTAEQWIVEIENKIEDLKSRHIWTYANFSFQISKETLESVVLYFNEKHPDYQVEYKICPRMLWDLIIRF